MKKTFVALSLAIASVFSFNALAQNPGKGQCGQQCQQGQGQCGQQPGRSDKMYRPVDIEEIAFEGILLTPEQQAAVDKAKADRKAKCQECKKQKEAADSTAVATRQQVQEEYLAQMKSILTPEQYTTFLENMVKAQPQGPKAGKGKCGKGQGQVQGKCGKGVQQRDCQGLQDQPKCGKGMKQEGKAKKDNKDNKAKKDNKGKKDKKDKK